MPATGESHATLVAADRSSVGQSLVLPIFAGASCLLALIQVLCIALGVARLRLSQPLAIVILILSLVISVLFATRFRVVESDPAVPPAPAKGAARVLNRVLLGLAVAALAWATWVWLQLVVLAWQREPLGWDSLWYHIPAIHEWAVRGHVAFYPLNPNVAQVPREVLVAGWLNFPMGVELTSFFVYALFKTSRLVDAGNLWYWPLAFTALAVIAGRLGARGVWRWLAGGLLFGVSLFVAQSVTAYIDPGFGATVMGSVAAAMVFVFGGEGRRGWKAVLLGANVGLMLGSKGFGLPFAVVIVVMSGAGLWWVGGWRRWRTHLVGLAVCGVVMLSVGGYWYIRNAVNTGNPIYPIQLQIGQKVLVPGYDIARFSRVEWMVPPLLKPYPPWARMFVAWTQPDAPARTSVTGRNARNTTIGGLGYIWLAGAIPAVLYLWLLAVRRRSGDLTRELAFLTLLILLLLALTPVKFYARYTYWLHALGLPVFAVVLFDAVSRWRRNWKHLITVCLAYSLVGVAVWESNRTLRQEWETGRDPDAGEGRPVFVSALQNSYPDMSQSPAFKRFHDSNLIARGPWLSSSGLLFGGVLAMPLGQRHVSVLAPHPSAEAVSALAEAGIEWVLWEVDESAELPETLARCADARYVYERNGGRAFHLVRLTGVSRADSAGRLDASRTATCIMPAAETNG